HSEEVQQLILVFQRRGKCLLFLNLHHRFKQVKSLVQEFSRYQSMVRLNQKIKIHVLAPPEEKSIICAEVYWSNMCNKVLHFFGMKCRINHTECSSLANSYEIYFVNIVLTANMIYAIIDISFNIVFERKIPVFF